MGTCGMIIWYTVYLWDDKITPKWLVNVPSGAIKHGWNISLLHFDHHPNRKSTHINLYWGGFMALGLPHYRHMDMVNTPGFRVLDPMQYMAGKVSYDTEAEPVETDRCSVL